MTDICISVIFMIYNHVMYKLDDLSYYFGRFEWDAYLISRGVRLLGDHHFSIADYKKIKSQIENIVQEQEVEMLLRYKETDSKVKMVEIIIYHPQKGKKTLNKLRQLDKRNLELEDNPLYDSTVEKILGGGKFTDEEKKYQRKLRKEHDLLEVEYGKLYGYDKLSIKKHMSKLDDGRS